MRVDQPIDILRLVRTRSVISGVCALNEMSRLNELLAEREGEAEYTVSFGVDRWSNRYVEIAVKAELSLICQRSMARFKHAVDQSQRLGLIETESDEAVLPEGYEPHLLSDEPVSLVDLVEDELILAVPLVPVAPGSQMAQMDDSTDSGQVSAERPNPFAVLADLKTNKK